MTSAYSLTIIALLIFTIISSVIDPSDEVMINYRNGNRKEYILFNKRIS